MVLGPCKEASSLRCSELALSPVLSGLKPGLRPKKEREHQRESSDGSSHDVAGNRGMKYEV